MLLIIWHRQPITTEITEQDHISKSFSSWITFFLKIIQLLIQFSAFLESEDGIKFFKKYTKDIIFQSRCIEYPTALSRQKLSSPKKTLKKDYPPDCSVWWRLHSALCDDEG